MAAGRSRAALARMRARSVSGIFADQLGVGGAAFGIGEADLAGAADDVAVGQDQPVGREDDAGPDAAVGGLVCRPPRVDADHGRARRVRRRRRRPSE